MFVLMYGVQSAVVVAGEDSMTPGTHWYNIGFFSNMYEYTAVIILAADRAVFDTYQKKDYSHYQSGNVSHATTVWYDVLQSESRLLLCCAPVTRDTRSTH